jgi:NitT/TauT family transport system ATP-binding protein
MGGTPQAGAEAIRFRGVTIEFPLADGGRYPAVAATDLAVGANEFVAIVGPTGCGKSTLLNVAAGCCRPHPAKPRAGRHLAGLNDKAGYLFQQDAVMPWKTARDNVAIGLEVAGIARAGGARTGARLAQARRVLPPSATAIPTSSRAGRGSASASPRC